MYGCTSGWLKASLVAAARSATALASPAASTVPSSSLAPSGLPAARRAMPIPTRASARSGATTRAARNSLSAAPGRRCSKSRHPLVSSSCASGVAGGGAAARSSATRWHFLYFLPEPQGQESLRPVAARRARASSGLGSLRFLGASGSGGLVFERFVSLAVMSPWLSVLGGSSRCLLAAGPYPKNMGRDHAAR